MTRRLLSPKWLLAHVLVAVLALTFVNLGFWQLRRLHDRRVANARITRTATFTGIWDGAHQWLVGGKAYLERPGLYVVTPLILKGGRAVLVHRGFVPLGTLKAPKIDGAATVSGTMLPSERRVPLTPSAIDTGPGTIRRIDVEQLQERYRMARLVDGYLLLKEPATEKVEIVKRVAVSEGPHRAYAMQWFMFTGVLLIGYGFVIWSRRGQLSSATPSPAQ